MTKILFAGIESQRKVVMNVKPPNVLFSYYAASKFALEYMRSEYCKLCLVDSGAFSFIYGKGNNDVDFRQYAKDYAEFVRKNNIRYYFELDLDAVIGLPETEKLKQYIEDIVGYRSIPVWHKSRGKEYFIKMCEEHDYVAIGGIAAKDIKKEELKYLKWFIDTAHSHNARIHGLGFTDYKYMKNLEFDTVDSTSWLFGARTGTIYIMKDSIPRQKCLRKQGYRCNGAKVAEHNMRLLLAYEPYIN